MRSRLPNLQEFLHSLVRCTYHALQKEAAKSMSLTSRKARLSGVVLLLASVIISVVLSEIVLRLISSGRYYVWPPGLHHVFRPAPGIMPGIKGESKFSINDYGLRGDPFSDNQTYRILAVGGSTTECLYLDDLEAWPYLLQEVLNAAADFKRHIWVGNAGKSGHTTRNHIVQVEMLTRQYPKIDAVLLLIGVNDFGQRLALDELYRPFPGLEKVTLSEYETLMDKSFFVWPSADWHSPFLKHTAIWQKVRVIKNRYFNSIKPTAIEDDAAQNYKKWRMHRQMASSVRRTLPDLSSALEEYSRNVNTIIDYTKSKGIFAIFVTQPYLWRSGLSSEERSLLWAGGIGKYQEELGHEYYSIEALAEGLKRYNETLLRICHIKNVECIDLESQLSKDTSNFYDDMHFNESGSRNVATILGGYFTQNLHAAFR
jgi:GDSL-like Lipase/Acylhydrolase family